MNNTTNTFDVVFNSNESSDNKQFNTTDLQYCIDYITRYNGTRESYFADYTGGIVQVICIETSEVMHEAIVM